MAPDPRVLLDAAFAAYGESAPSGYSTTGQILTNEAGLYLCVYRKDGTDEYIVAFRGTEGNLADINTDIHKGWPQYNDSDKEIQDLLQKLMETASRIDITGHSLGGALAQFAVYDLIDQSQENPIDTSKINLTTWNSLGGEWALSQFRSYNPAVAATINGTHYYRGDDIVARLGNGHVGGVSLRLLDPERQIATVVDAHMKQELAEGLDYGTGHFTEPDYFRIADSSQGIVALLIGGINKLQTPQSSLDGIKMLVAGIGLLPLANATTLKWDLGTLIGSMLMQEVMARSHPLDDQILEQLKQFSTDLLSVPTTLTAVIDGMVNQLETLVQQGWATLPNNAAEIANANSLLTDLVAKLGQVDPDQAALTSWYIRRTIDLLDAAVLPISLLPGVPSLLDSVRFIRAGMDLAAMFSCPLILDLDGDGIETLALETRSIHFDHNGNRYAERSGWVGADDGLLVCDRDHNQTIDKGHELFGNQTRLANGSLAANGFEALKEFDSNEDGSVDEQDADWSRLQVWRDRNSNGNLDAGELLSLAAAGIASLDLAYENVNLDDGQGNQQRQLGGYRNREGERRSLVDVWFQVDTARSLDLDPISIDPEIALLPNIAGQGNVPSLHQAMQRDQTGQLRLLVEQWLQASPAVRASLIRPLIYRWTGVYEHPASQARGLDDIRSLEALEALIASPYRNGQGIQVDSAGIVIGLTFDKICGLVGNALEARELLGAILSPELLSLDPQQSGYHWDGMGVISALQRRYGDQPSDELLLRLGRAMRSLPATGTELMATIRQMALEATSPLGQKLWLLVMDDQVLEPDSLGWLIGSDANELLKGGAGNDKMTGRLGHDVLLGQDQDDQLYGFGGDDVLDGGTGNDTVDGGDDQDTLIGGSGNDDLQGGAGNDTLIGGPGNDKLAGGYGLNVYCFDVGDGQDSTSDWGGPSSNLIQFGSAVQPGQLRVRRREESLILELNPSDRLTITNFFSDNFFQPRPGDSTYIQFNDGSRWSRSDLMHMAVQGTDAAEIINGTNLGERIAAGAGDDTIYGNGGNDQILGDSGNDSIFCYSGDDSLDGGSGNDTLIGGAGNNSYRFSRGGGADLIVSWENISPEAMNRIICDADVGPSDLRVSREYNGLVLSIIGTNDSITTRQAFQGEYINSLLNPFKKVVFSDGTLWTMEAMALMAMIGNDEPEFIEGLAGNDTIKGMGGDDILFGHSGNDLILGGTGDDAIGGMTGNDTIEAGSGNNTIYFSRGGGQDIIRTDWNDNLSHHNILEFGQYINPADVTVKRHGWGLDLEIKITGSDDQIILEQFFRTDSYSVLDTPIQLVRFENGTSWNAQKLVNLALTGTAAAEELVGSPSHDRIDGDGGNDTITGARGSDTITGGLGDNIYHYALYDGNDTLRSYLDTNTKRLNTLSLEGGITPVDLNAIRVGNRLRLNILSSGESISVDDFFLDGTVQNTYNPLQLVRFSDGSSWTALTLASKVSNMISGTSGNNILTGGSGDEWFDGLAGDDQLYGLAGNDQLNGGTGNDTLLGGDGDDLLNGGDGLDTASYAGVNNSVAVNLALTGTQATGAGGFDELIAVEHLIGGSGADHLLGNGGANRIDGGDGDDLIDGGPGNDTLLGGNHQAGDRLSYAMATAGVKVSLAISSSQNTGGAGSDLVNSFEHLLGSHFNDNLSGNTAANQLEGGAGNDTLQGGGGADRLLGGDGTDLFVYASLSDAGNGSGSRDLISDWGSGDRIDLVAIDARADKGGNQAFSWIGNAPFSGLGQLRYTTLSNGNGLLEGNCSGSLAADFQLELSGAPNLGAAGIAL